VEIHHKIKPPKNWREFLKEYGIIVLGVLTALGAEQAAEAIHHRAEVREAREALNEEMAWNFTSFKLQVEEMDCVAARIDELERWKASWESGRPVKLIHPIVMPASVAFRSSVWRISSADAASRMPLKERITYAGLYDAFDLTQRQREIQLSAWADLLTLQQAQTLSDAQLLQLTKAIATIRGFDATMRSNYALMSAEAGVLRLPASRNPVFDQNRSQLGEVCKPLLAG
jgi:hypothetical protein